jgi:hypothetical protein
LFTERELNAKLEFLSAIYKTKMEKKKFPPKLKNRPVKPHM